MLQALVEAASRGTILAPGEPPPFEVVNPQGTAGVLIVCDHASNAVPARLARLGLGEEALAQHVAYDIGAADVARCLAAMFDAPLVLAGYSRLVIDPNRHLSDPTSIVEASDSISIPGNRGLSVWEEIQRAQEFFYPYHDAIHVSLERIRRQGRVPAVVAVHSFTPVYAGIRRPWQVGVLWHRDPRIARPLLQRLERLPDLCVGDNQPYNAREPVGYTMDAHCEHNGYPHVLIEIRQDLIDDEKGAGFWAELLHSYLAEILADPGLYALSDRRG
ncbi:MAG: N-formylglutamate amidohydrolase [Gammaproteobacteria bacterium]|nr:N-formylglutamate amidohydrolase [Gammaproteobacteria bacterium]